MTYIDNSPQEESEIINRSLDEILSHPPGWLLKWGITIFFVVLTAILSVTWFIKYPDLVSATLKILPGQLPKSVIVRTEGRLQKLYVNDNQDVKKGDLLAIIENTGNFSDIFKLEEIINKLIEMEGDVENIHKATIPQYFNLGDLQKSFQAFQEAFTRSKSATHSGKFSVKKSTIFKELESLENLRVSTLEQLSIQEYDLNLTLDEAEAQQRLADKGYVSAQESQNAKRQYLNKKQAYEQAKGALQNNIVLQNQKNYELLEIEKNIEEQNISVIQSIYSIKSDIEAWKQRYIVFAPFTGTVHFITKVQENQQLKSGEEIMVIAPDIIDYQGEMWLGQYNLGKVKKLQKVTVKFDSFPYHEYGTVQGEIVYIGDIPRDSATLVNVNFPKGLVTNSGKNLPYKYGMTANAEIITEDIRLLERFFYDLKKTLRR